MSHPQPSARVSTGMGGCAGKAAGQCSASCAVDADAAALSGAGKAAVITAGIPGGAGEDSFRFSTELGGDNVDRIKDFNVTDDMILLDLRIFTEAGDEGGLSYAAFHSSTSGIAQDVNDRIIYDTNDGFLYYDSDGSGDTDAILFAQLGRNLDLSESNFVIV